MADLDRVEPTHAPPGLRPRDRAPDRRRRDPEPPRQPRPDDLTDDAAAPGDDTAPLVDDYA